MRERTVPARKPVQNRAVHAVRLVDLLLPREVDDDEPDAPRELAPISGGDLVFAFVIPIAALFIAVPQLLRDRVGPGLAVIATGLAGALCWWGAVALFTS